MPSPPCFQFLDYHLQSKLAEYSWRFLTLQVTHTIHAADNYIFQIWASCYVTDPTVTVDAPRNYSLESQQAHWIRLEKLLVMLHRPDLRPSVKNSRVLRCLRTLVISWGGARQRIPQRTAVIHSTDFLKNSVFRYEMKGLTSQIMDGSASIAVSDVNQAYNIMEWRLRQRHFARK